MKKQITFITMLLFLLAGVTGCQKDEETSAKTDIFGKWQVAKIETTIAGAATVVYTGISSDYIEFRNNEQDEVILSLNSSNYIGNYVILDNDGLNLNYNNKTRVSKITTITDKKLEFTATVEGSTPQTTEKYYLIR
jgi:hypothetical protein